MKSTVAWILAIVLCLSVFAMVGCKSESSKEPETKTEETIPSEAPIGGPVAGGWTVSSEPASPAIPEEAKEAFDAAIEGLTGVGYEPLAYLGSQVVAGVNYGFLCRSQVVSPDAQASLSIVKVYRDLEGNATILETKDVAIPAYTENSDLSYVPEGMAGGWTLPEDAEPAALPEAVQTAFDTAFADFAGVGYQPLAYLGSQVVAGENYAVLCRATMVSAEPQSALAVVTIYADLEGGAQILSIAGFDFP